MKTNLSNALCSINPSHIKTGDLVRLTHEFTNFSTKRTALAISFWKNIEEFTEGVAPTIKYVENHQHGVVISIIQDPYRRSTPPYKNYYMFDWAVWVVFDNQFFLMPLMYIKE